MDPHGEQGGAGPAPVLLLERGAAGWPSELAAIEAPPERLWLRGRPELLAAERARIAVVGTRTPSPYGAATAQRFAAELARAGAVVVSGLARGIDQAAHARSPRRGRRFDRRARLRRRPPLARGPAGRAPGARGAPALGAAPGLARAPPSLPAAQPADLGPGARRARGRGGERLGLPDHRALGRRPESLGVGDPRPHRPSDGRRVPSIDPRGREPDRAARKRSCRTSACSARANRRRRARATTARDADPWPSACCRPSKASAGRPTTWPSWSRPRWRACSPRSSSSSSPGA